MGSKFLIIGGIGLLLVVCFAFFITSKPLVRSSEVKSLVAASVDDAAEVENLVSAGENEVAEPSPVLSTSVEGEDNGLTSSLPSVKPVLVSLDEAKAKGYSYCGDGVCDASESCNICPKDCGCKSGEFCNKESNVCQQHEVIGDGICTDEEKAQGVCIDCGCSGELFCNSYNNKCVNPISLSKEQQDKIVSDWESNHADDKFESSSDSYYGDLAVKSIVFDCSSVYACKTVLSVDETGKIVSEDHTT